MKIKIIIIKTPIIGLLVKKVNRTFFKQNETFPGTIDYWKKRYNSGGNSGAGSYNILAEFKSKVLNDFLRKNKLNSVIEFGCGDGNQLKLAKYPYYTGFDVSQEAINRCKKLFNLDKLKKFELMDKYNNETAELTLSLDVIYHLIEDDVFFSYMNILFNASTKYVIIYSSNTDQQEIKQAEHVKHRKFTNWIDLNKPEWILQQHLPNKYPYDGKDETIGSLADFYIYEKV